MCTVMTLFNGSKESEVEKTHPAGFNNWARRRSDKLRHDGRPAWQARPSHKGAARLAVLLHVHYPELLDEILGLIAEIPVNFDLIVTNSSGVSLQFPNAGPNCIETRVLEVSNHGRDILPMVEVVNAGLLAHYDLVFKVHTKKSAWRAVHEDLAGSGEEWRDSFLKELAGNRDQIQLILSTFAEDPSVGIVTADGSLVGPEHWGGDFELTKQLLRRLELELAPWDLEFASGSIYWIRGFLLNGLYSFDLSSEDFDEEAGQIDGTTAHAVERAIGVLCREAGFGLRETSQIVEPRSKSSWGRYEVGALLVPEARVFPFYLPQFHTFPENESWWGPGFTEWNNVASAKPVFVGHRQPNLPSDLGFYDLANREVRSRQYKLAHEAGLEGFMYYYYWFAGKRLMDFPVEELVRSSDNHSFCIMWANENWTRRWDGGDANILIAQEYDRVPAEQFIEDIRHLITDERYTCIDGRPLVAVYRITQIPDYQAVLDHWRRRAIEFGLPGLEIVTVDVGKSMQGIDGDVAGSGLDGVLEFPPHNREWVATDLELNGLESTFSGNILRYGSLAEEANEALLEGVEPHRFPGVLINFDNTARRQHQPDLWVGSNPYTFRRWLRSAVLAVQDRPEDRRIVFINAWNEWAEGAILEPTQRFGHNYLQAARSAIICP